jgi:CHAD domain-containing protein
LDEAVHESRKCFKKLRGLLRLVRAEIGEPIYQRENKCFRDAGRLLSDLRDSAVRIQTLDDLLEAFEDTSAGGEVEAIEAMRETLVIFYQATYQRVVVEEKSLARAARMAREARDRVGDWPVEDESFSAVAGGLQKIYRRGRNRHGDASEDPTTEAFHEWRKRVKYLWYSVRILCPIWPEPMTVLADEIHDLSDFLGDDHDFASLLALVEEQPSLLSSDAARDALFSLINQSRADLQRRSFQMGERIYAESPEDFVGRLEGYWQASPLSDF